MQATERPSPNGGPLRVPVGTPSDFRDAALNLVALCERERYPALAEQNRLLRAVRLLLVASFDQREQNR